MKLTIEAAHALLMDAMGATDHTVEESRAIADHLIDCELRGLSFGGLARGLSIVERLQFTMEPRRPITTLQETAVSAALDGGDHVGYLVGQRATDLAIEKADQSGLAVVGAKETWYTGMFSYYLEQVTAAGFAGMIAGSGAQLVAPHGGTEGRFATNPIAFGFPTTGDPIIWDIGTSSLMLGEVITATRTGEDLPEGVAYDADGAPTRDPMAALGGAITVWGGHKGSGLAVVVQLLGMMCGASMAPDGLQDCGFFILVVDPGLLTPPGEFPRRADEYADQLRTTRPVDPAQPVRVPFERSAQERRRRLDDGEIDVDDDVVSALRNIVQGAGLG